MANVGGKTDSFVVVPAQSNRDTAVRRDVCRVEAEDVFVLFVGNVINAGEQSDVL